MDTADRMAEGAIFPIPRANHATCFSIRNLSSSVICPDSNALVREFLAYAGLMRWNFPVAGVGAFRGFARVVTFLPVTSCRVVQVLFNFLSAGILTGEQNARDGILDIKCDSQTADFC